MTTPEINRASIDDLETIHLLGRRTFLEAFAKDNKEEDIHQYVNEAFGKEQLTKELTNPESEFYLTSLDDQSIGYLKVNYGQAQTEKHDLHAVEIERIYVSEAYYGKSVGKFLFKKAFEIAQSRKASYIWLGVWEKNLRAIQFYYKHGFIAFGKHSFLIGKDLQTDILMQLEVTPSSSIAKPIKNEKRDQT
ncbi:GNAT family N-acetyltransferase [Reichenbachiella sp.]|uniref:GNAT family N-acetyltransferase n=1 Tax=Reichenbachiella sp. TaxID=2184521 RepID=UPI00329871D5